MIYVIGIGAGEMDQISPERRICVMCLKISRDCGASGVYGIVRVLTDITAANSYAAVLGVQS